MGTYVAVILNLGSTSNSNGSRKPLISDTDISSALPVLGLRVDWLNFAPWLGED